MFKIKKILATLLALVMLCSVGTSVFAATPLKAFKVKLVDKNSVSIQNALITIFPVGQPIGDNSEYFTTDANGEFRIPSAFLGEYNIKVRIPTLDKYATETIKYKFTSENTKKIMTIKSKLENQNQALFEAEKRTDIYLRNSKDGVVKNMKIELKPTFQIPHVGFVYGENTYAPFAYTNDDGRVTFESPYAGEYEVEYSWLGGKSSGGKITVTDENVVSQFVLKFDETKLPQK